MKNQSYENDMSQTIIPKYSKKLFIFWAIEFIKSDRIRENFFNFRRFQTTQFIPNTKIILNYLL